MHRVIIYILPLLIFSLLSCNENPQDIEKNIKIIEIDKDTSKTKYIKPLNVGNYWIYRVSTYDDSGNLVSTRSDTELVDRDSLIDGSLWYNSSILDIDWQSNLSDGLHFRFEEQDGTINDWLEAKFPGSQGYTWQRNDLMRELIATDTLVSFLDGFIAAHHFHDSKQISPNAWEYKDVFYTPGVGMIKQVSYRQTNSGPKTKNEEYELIFYELN